jgi:hypothetical protein
MPISRWDGDHVLRAGAVDLLDHGRQCGAFARAGDADDQDQALTFGLHDVGIHGWEVEVLVGRDLGFDTPDGGVGVVAGAEHVDAEAVAGGTVGAF